MTVNKKIGKVDEVARMLPDSIRRLCLALLLCAAAGAAAQAGAEAARRGDLDRTAEQLRARLRREPGSPEANLALAAVYLKMGRASLALEPARRALAAAPDNFLARLTLADALLESRHGAEAQAQFAELARSQPDRPEVWFGLARASLRRAKEAPERAEAGRQTAQTALERLLECPAPPALRLQLAADVLSDAGQYPKAAELLEQAAALEPANGAVWLALGKARWHNVEFERAQSALEKALQLQAGDAEACFLLGDLYARKDRPREALPLLERSLALDPGAEAAHATLAKVYGQLGQPGRQIAQLESIAPARRTAAVWYQLYRACQRAGRAADAQQALAQYKQKQKGNDTHADEP
ncbi:MAG TPA: tetratricopeptide repeat protein [Bryobacteraceae bacterium]|nr:tetratricopeptide repeat protein [Bryobacteraceae bacterium]